MLLKQVFKTYEGARKRAAFENAITPSEIRRGDRLYPYHWSVVTCRDPFGGPDTYRLSKVRK
jgi:hypothetical protein